MNWLEFHISYACQNDCIFCSESERLDQFSGATPSLLEIKRNLAEKRRQGFSYVNLTGGEPTLHPDIFEILEFARRLNFKIYVGTNGLSLANPDFCERLLNLTNDICISFHGHNRRLYEAHTMHRGGFDKVTAALDNLDRYAKDNFVFINIMVTSLNIEEIEDILEYSLSRKSVGQVLLSIVAPEGNGLSNFKQISPDILRLSEKVEGLVKISLRHGKPIRFFGMPFCLLGPHWKYANDLMWEARLTLERCAGPDGPALVGVESPHPTRHRIRIKPCGNCRFNSDTLCGGIFPDYVDSRLIQEIERMLKISGR